MVTYSRGNSHPKHEIWVRIQKRESIQKENCVSPDEWGQHYGTHKDRLEGGVKPFKRGSILTGWPAPISPL